MVEPKTREPYIRGLPSSPVLQDAIDRTALLNQDGGDAEMGLSLINRHPARDDSPGPGAVVEPEAEDADPDEPKIDDGLGPFLGAKLDDVLAELRKLNAVPSNKPGSPTSVVGRVSTSSLTYVDLAVWTISSDRVGSLQEISISSDNPALAQFRLTVANEQQWTDLILDAPLTIPFRENELSGDSEVALQVLSDGATSITAFASIAGVEREA